ncbi:MAG TPA: radical SAM protein, partial [Nitrospirota bacterium]
GLPCRVLDANLEGLLWLMRQPHAASDTWTRRAVRNLSNNLAALRDIHTYQSPDRYRRAVKDVNRLLAVAARSSGIVAGLADYQDENLSPLRSSDLIASAEHPERNPFYPWFRKRLPEVMDAFSPRSREGREGKSGDSGSDKHESISAVGFSLNYLSQALCVFAMIGFIKKEFPDRKIVLGGGLITSWMKQPGWKDPFSGLVDHCISGPGEGQLLKLLGVKDERRHFPPDYESLSLSDYLSPGFILPYSGSSGCYWSKCSFCPETAEDNPYVPVPTEQAMTDLTTLIAKTKPRLVHLLDNSVSPSLMRALADDPIGIPWYGFARISRELTDLDYCRALKRSGCVMLKLGLESGDQGVLDKLGKGIDLETASLVLQNLRSAGIAAYVYLLFGTPVETVVEARKTLEFVVRHRDAITFLNLAVFNMPICGRDSAQVETGLFYEGDLSLYSGFRHPAGWDRMHVRQFLDREFKKHPVVSGILKNDPPVFTSNHAAFFAAP